MTNKYKNRLYSIGGIALLIALIAYIVFLFIPPAALLTVFNLKFNSPEKINNLILKQVKFLVLFFSFTLLVIWLYNSPYYLTILQHFKRLFNATSKYLNSTLLLVISILYLFVLFFVATTHYDLGYDEAWYIHWAKNFSDTGIAFYTTNGNISIIDTITMLPYYILAPLLFWVGFNEVWHFKVFCASLSIFSLASLFIFVKKTANKVVAVFALFFLILQPGFGFISTSYFGELFQLIFLLGGTYYWLVNEDLNSRKKFLIAGLLFALAIHTKFQLLIILVLAFIVCGILIKNSGSNKMLFYTVLFTLLIGFIRLLPILLVDPKNVRYLLIMDWFSGNSISQSLSFTAFEKMQLFDRFFPISLFCIIILTSFIYLKKPFERFLTVYSLIAVLWWIFLFPYTTYRHPFIGIITLCILAAILSVNFYTKLAATKSNNLLPLKYLTTSIVLFLMLYGFSTNLIYAYIGYNDGVQFDLDGFKNRLFSPIQQDNSQREFYSKLKQTIKESDTLYNASFISRFYLDNPVYTLNSMYLDIDSKPVSGVNEKLLLVTRENYPLGFERIYKELDSLGYGKRLIIKVGENELHSIKRLPSPY